MQNDYDVVLSAVSKLQFRRIGKLCCVAWWVRSNAQTSLSRNLVNFGLLWGVWLIVTVDTWNLRNTCALHIVKGDTLEKVHRNAMDGNQWKTPENRHNITMIPTRSSLQLSDYSAELLSTVYCGWRTSVCVYSCKYRKFL